ncbi:MurR/RpiR family transcriptional regulator [Nesterenkonia muleiensis]|uniref:MurR/RpiR family transcriptional regulator n=1 Tax=Nesterenkonia muleiensis TaxID=2282648 RepID=UPI00192E4C17|nr:MurR/RpiR family transcriptional regulator [Nesterenkonia muleiensis]
MEINSAPTPQPRTDVTLVLRGMMDSLRPAERRIAESLLSDPESFSRSSIKEVASRAGTSTTTVVRFYKRIGFTRFKDLLHDVAEQAARERMASSEFPAQASDIDRHDSLGQVVAKVARDETLSISDTAKVLDLDELSQAVQLLAQADRIHIFGIGSSAVIGEDLQRKISRIGRTAIDWTEAHTAWTAAAVAGPLATAVAISHSGRTSDTVEFLRLARASGAATVAITNAPDSPLAAVADAVLRTAARETEFRSGALGSRIAQLMVIDCLFIGLVQTDYDASVDALRATYQAVRTRAARS